MYTAPMITKIYVAGKFEEKQQVRAAQKLLRDNGFEISHDWTTEDASGITDPTYLANFLKDCAIDDYQGVLECDAVLLLNHDRAFGAMVEMGLALAFGRTVYVVGSEIRDNIFFHLPAEMGVRLFKTVEEAVQAICIDDMVSDAT